MSLKLKLNIMITCLLIIVMVIGAWFMLFNARENVRAEIDSTASLALHLLDREILSFSTMPLSDETTHPFRLGDLSHIRHLRIEFFDVEGQLRDTNQVQSSDSDEPVSPQWFLRLMTNLTSMNTFKREVVIDNAYAGQLVITPDPSYEIEEVWHDTKNLLGLVFVFFIAVNTLVYDAINRALKPVKHILDALTNLEKGNLDTRLPSFELPELSSIASKFNHTAETLEESINRNVRLSREIINLEEVERKNLARDLHDEIGQSITAINVDAQAILNYKDTNPGLLKSAQAILNVSKKMMGITHQILERLRPDAIDKLGLKIALEDLVMNWKQKLPDVHCTIDISGELTNLPEDISVTIYRALQESLTNIARYAAPKKVSINVLQEPDSLVLMVEDDGNGFDTVAVSNGFGLIGMRERVEGLGGDFELDSAIGQGTNLVIRLPITA